VLAQPFAVDGNELHATVSIGIALYDGNTREPADMLSQADLALYRAKDGGRNQYHFHSLDLDTKVREHVALAEELHAAVENREFELHYQPQVDIASGRIVGVEALMRWNHPRRGLISPSLFIPVAEKTGLIVAMGRWAIGDACRQYARWRDEGIAPSVVSVNISAVQVRAVPDLDHEVAAVLAENRIGPNILELELTESILIETTEMHNDILIRLRRAGARLAIDDFGTGYSSLEYLHTYPINRIKIAQQFMRELPENQSDAAIVRATIGLARALKIDLVAEGVETAEQLALLRAAGCRVVQGYYFSRPVDAGRMSQQLREKRFGAPAESERRVAT
jgi:EAL domain-containing protein (putative c-di-GMP-specific phosphodiesterase class I)